MPPGARIDGIGRLAPKPFGQKRLGRHGGGLRTYVCMALRPFMRRPVVVDLPLDVDAIHGVVDAMLDIAEIAHASPHSVPGRIFSNICRAAPLITPLSLGSPFISASETFFACCKVMCGGSGGTSGSVFTSSTTGISLASACSQAEPSSCGLST